MRITARQPERSTGHVEWVLRVVSCLPGAICLACLVGCVSGRGGPGDERGASRVVDPTADVDPSRAYLHLNEIEPAAVPGPPNPDATTEPGRRTVQRIASARRLLAEERYTEAIAELEKALRYDPVYAPTYRLLGIACRRSGASGRASAFLNKAALFDPSDLLAHYHLARVYGDGGDKEQALLHLRLAWACPDAEEPSVSRPLAALELARHLEEAGYYTAAEGLFEYFERVRSAWTERDLSDPDAVELVRVGPEFAAEHIGRINERLGRLDRAAAAYERALGYAPDNLVLRTGSARLLMRLGRAEEARNLTRGLLAAAANDAEWNKIRELYALIAEPDALLEDLRMLAALPSPSVRVLDALFEESQEVGDFAGAQAALLRRVEIDDGRHAQLYVRAADFYAGQGYSPRGLRLLGSTLADHPDRLGPICAAADRLAADETLARSVLSAADSLLGDEEIEPREAAAIQYLLARVALFSNIDPRARTWLEDLAARDDALPSVLVLLGELHLRQGRWSEALDRVQAGVRRDPAMDRDAEAHVVLARAYEGLDETDAAQEHYERANALRRDNTAGIYAFGRLLERIEEPLRARRKYQDVLAVEPEHAGAHEALVRNFLAQREGRLAQEQLARMEQSVGPTRSLRRCRALWDYFNEVSASRRGRRDITLDYVSALELLLKEDPSDVLTGIDLAGVLCVPLREYERAGELLDRILRIEPYAEQALELRILVHNSLLEYENTIALLGRMLDRHPRRQPWMRHLVRVRLVLQDYGGAIELLERMLLGPDAKSESLRLRLFLLDAYVLADRVTEAIEVARQWDAGQEDEGEVSRFAWQVRLINNLIATGTTEKAISLSEEWYERSPGDASARGALFNGLMASWEPGPNSGSVSSGVSSLDRARLLTLTWLEDDPDNAELNERMIYLELLENNTRAAVELASNFRTDAERDPQIRLWLAQILMEADHHEESVRMFRQLARSSGDFDHYRRAAGAMIAARQFEEAERYLLNLKERVRVGTWQSTELHYLLYLAYLSWDKPKRAEERLVQLTKELEPLSYERGSPFERRYFGCCNDLGYFWADAGRDLEQAEEMIRRAVAYEPRRAAYLDSLGWALYKRGDLAGALSWLTRAVRGQRYEAIRGINGGGVPQWILQTAGSGGTQDAVLLGHLGDTYWALDRHEEAVPLWRRASALLEKRAAREDLSSDEEGARQGLADRLENIERGEEPIIAEIVGETESGASD